MKRWLLPFPLLFAGCGCPPYPPCCTYESVEPIAVAYDKAELAGSVVDNLQTEAWWEPFNDPQLERLMSEAVALNPQISLLQSKVREAYGEVKIAQSPLFPRLDLLDDFQFTQITRTGEFPRYPNFPLSLAFGPCRSTSIMTSICGIRIKTGCSNT